MRFELEEQATNSFSRHPVLAGNPLSPRQEGFRFADLDNQVSPFLPTNDPRDKVPNLILELIVDVLLLKLPKPLLDSLFSSLCGNPAEVGRIDFTLHHVSHLRRIGIETGFVHVNLRCGIGNRLHYIQLGPSLHGSGLGIYLDPQLARGVHCSLGRSLYGAFNSRNHVFATDSLFLFHVLEDGENFAAHDLVDLLMVEIIRKKKAGHARSFSKGLDCKCRIAIQSSFSTFVNSI